MAAADPAALARAIPKALKSLDDAAEAGAILAVALASTKKCPPARKSLTRALRDETKRRCNVDAKHAAEFAEAGAASARAVTKLHGAFNARAVTKRRDAFPLCAAWRGRVPEHLSEFFGQIRVRIAFTAQFGSGSR